MVAKHQPNPHPVPSILEYGPAIVIITTMMIVAAAFHMFRDDNPGYDGSFQFPVGTAITWEAIAAEEIEIEEGLPQADVLELIALLQKHLDQEEHDPGPILLIRRNRWEIQPQNGDWEIWAGFMVGPLNATVFTYYFTKIDGVWVLTDEGGFIS